MNKQLLGVIDATTTHDNLKEMTTHRSLAALPIGGRYRLIDFVLSNMVNSGIRSVAIFPNAQNRSLMDHLGSGKNWDLNRKRDGLFFFPSTNVAGSGTGIGCFEHYSANLDYFYRSTQKYALITNCFTVFNMDFGPMLDMHVASGCDITEAVNDKGSMQLYLIKTSLLIQLLENRKATGYTCMRDVVTDLQQPYRICHYKYNGFVSMIDSVETYFKTSMNLLNPQIWNSLFLKERPIFTKVKDEPPTRYLKGSKVQNAMIANGCQIDGIVENSIISRGVKIGKGTHIKNSIIMQKCNIGENCVLDTVIMDKDVKVEAENIIIGNLQSPFVIEKGTIQGALMNK
ncbi:MULTISPECIES: sugar phosphate nucleotidyltransferase [unclassified Bacillus (in: firmicutes)]|uniref:sugar phosphate nucleotidyltransferase n=1 Tax=unclassified Bacillus (in: firmicutes) TaxID=185979 RepID=UPI0008ED28A8|nr:MULTISPECIES: sugar phosphate nucleotidyltransferase [unclassified Bacillus (in: firmicutes)]SFB18549.1 glucose-1-phosphate adenylyltransferase [Bacillus sp. UNCCL13]SFQ75877.1 glucose-1-phosphate adenylyltransferase [Bacillus sp. cl95]